MKFYRIARAEYSTRGAVFSGAGASKADHRWSWGTPKTRAVYCSDSVALACLECLVHIRPLPRILPASCYWIVEIPDALLERPPIESLPLGWNALVATAGSREFGSQFLAEKRAVGLVVPTAIVPVGINVIINPDHPLFDLSWVQGPWKFDYDARLE